MNVARSGARPDPLLVKEALAGKVDVTLSYLADLIEVACFPPQLPHYIGILTEMTRRRRLYRCLNQAVGAMLEERNSEEVERILFAGLQGPRPDADTLDLAGLDPEPFFDQKERPGVTFGLDELDAALGGGIYPGEMCVVAARTSVGKSAFAVMAGVAAAEAGWPVLYMSYEMPTDQVWKRVMAYLTRLPLRKFRQGLFTESEKELISEVWDEKREVLGMIRVNTRANTPQDLFRLAWAEKLAGRLGFLVVDHAGRMLADGKARSEYERVSEIANKLKDIAIKLEVPVLVLWQLNRFVEKTADKKPTLADLRDSGQAEEIADIVLLLYRDSYYDRSIPLSEATVTITVAKARDGGITGDVVVPWLRIIAKPHEDEDEAGEEVQF